MLFIAALFLSFVLPFVFADDDADRSVSILLDGQESTMEFVDMSDREVSKKNLPH